MAVWNVAVIGVTGIVGRAIVELLEERAFPVASLFVFASEQNKGEIIRFKGKSITVKTMEEADWSQIHIIFLATGAQDAVKMARELADSGCIVIDSSGFFADFTHIPLVLPNINDDALVDYRQSNIIATPNGVVTQLLKAVTAVTTPENMIRLDVSSYLSASFYGKDSVETLAEQSARLLNGLAIEEAQIAFNVEQAINITHRDEMLVEQCRRILNDGQFAVSFNLVNVPVFYGMAQNINMTLKHPLDTGQLRFDLERVPGIEFIPNNELPLLASKKHSPATLTIGNIRYAYGIPELLQLWSTTDGGFLAALTAIGTAERLIKDYL